jgi:hypothetical protein
MRRLTLIVVGLLAGCASMSGSRTLQIDTRSGGQPLPGAVCQVSLGRETFSVTTPARMDVSQAQGDLQMVCNKPGYRTSELYYRATSSSGSSVGLGVGGGGSHVGLGLGMNFPIQSGRSDYPPQLTIDLTRQ